MFRGGGGRVGVLGNGLRWMVAVVRLCGRRRRGQWPRILRGAEGGCSDLVGGHCVGGAGAGSGGGGGRRTPTVVGMVAGAVEAGGWTSGWLRLGNGNVHDVRRL